MEELGRVVLTLFAWVLARSQGRHCQSPQTYQTAGLPRLPSQAGNPPETRQPPAPLPSASGHASPSPHVTIPLPNKSKASNTQQRLRASIKRPLGLVVRFLLWVLREGNCKRSRVRTSEWLWRWRVGGVFLFVVSRCGVAIECLYHDGGPRRRFTSCYFTLNS